MFARVEPVAEIVCVRSGDAFIRVVDDGELTKYSSMRRLAANLHLRNTCAVEKYGE